MDWRSVTFDWNRARAFLVTAEEGSFSAAARALGMTQPTLGRQVTALEEELGVLLFERVGRGLVLTNSGTRLMDHVRAMGEAAAAVSLAASGQAQQVEGLVAITASEIYASWLLPPVLKRLSTEAPGIRVEVVASNAIRDLKRREADIAIRNTRPDQADLIGKLIAEDCAGFFATRDYLDRAPAIRDKPDLARAKLIGFDENANFIAALNARDMPVTEDNFAVTGSTHPVHWEMLRAGLGVGVGPVGYARAFPELIRVLPEVTLDYPVWLVAHRELRTSPRVRMVWDLLAEMLPGQLRGA
ncbi:LysR family transcriptional regulator [Tropicibacter sp. S64]|uniref:LysR family transcriptional regulator n=1 Tax=Tropicibacter sp. S64 TaxID=3415122 RepID=UPI003C7CE985